MCHAGGLQPLPGVGVQLYGSLHRRADLLHALEVNGGQQFFLGREVTVQRARQHANRARNVAYRSALKTLRAKQPRRFVQYLRQAAVDVRFSGAGHTYLLD